MVDHTRAQLAWLLRLEFIRFCIVGGLGFVINLALLLLLSRVLALPIFVAQFCGAEVALFSNFMLHHHWTYRSHHVTKSLRRLVIEFHATSWPAIIGSTLMVTLGVHVFHLTSIIALVISSLIALLWNFLWSKYVVWRHASPDQAHL